MDAPLCGAFFSRFVKQGSRMLPRLLRQLRVSQPQVDIPLLHVCQSAPIRAVATRPVHDQPRQGRYGDSPGRRPGYGSKKHKALQGRPEYLSRSSSSGWARLCPRRRKNVLVMRCLMRAKLCLANRSSLSIHFACQGPSANRSFVARK